MSAEPRRLRLAARTGAIAPFEVMEIQSLARQVEAAGRDVIHLEIGEPDFDTPDCVRKAAVDALGEKQLESRVKKLEKEMLEAARNLEFEKAARVRDQLALLREQAFGAPLANEYGASECMSIASSCSDRSPGRP